MNDQDTAKHSDSVGRWVLVATITASGMAFIGQSALNVALPAIQQDLGASGADLLWIVNAFQLMLGALILVGGALGDRYGRKRIFATGIILHAVASLACAVAPNTGLLIAARALQGLGGALMVPGSLAIISAYFKGHDRGVAIGTWSAATTMLSIAAPVLGGFLAENNLWRMIFFINLPLTLVALWALRYIPESRDANAPDRLDFLGAALITLGLSGIVYGATEIGRLGAAGLGNPVLIGALLLGFASLVFFVWHASRSDHPLVPLNLFRSRTFSGANLMTLLLYGALGGALFFMPLNLVQVQGYGATVAGLSLLPLSILLIVMSRWAGGLVETVGPRLPLTFGPVIVGFGFMALAWPGLTNGPQDYFVSFFPGVLLLGLGMGVTVAPLTTTVMSSVSSDNAGIASGINNAMSRASGVLAVAILGGVALVSFSGILETQARSIGLDDPQRDALMLQAENLAEAQPPESLSTEQAAAVENAIDMAFVETFRLIMLIAGVICILSGILAWLLVDPRLVSPDDAPSPEPA